MKKVVYSIKKVRKSNEKLSGLGFINDECTLFCKCVSKNGKQYTRAFDDVDKHCFPIFGKENEYKGYVSISDVRYFSDEWYNHILIRTAKDEQDYRGGFNNYTTLDGLELRACELLDVVELTKEKEFLAIDYNIRENPSELDAVEEFGYALLKVVDDSVSKYLAPITSYTHS